MQLEGIVYMSGAQEEKVMEQADKGISQKMLAENIKDILNTLNVYLDAAKRIDLEVDIEVGHTTSKECQGFLDHAENLELIPRISTRITL